VRVKTRRRATREPDRAAAAPLRVKTRATLTVEPESAAAVAVRGKTVHFTRLLLSAAPVPTNGKIALDLDGIVGQGGPVPAMLMTRSTFASELDRAAAVRPGSRSPAPRRVSRIELDAIGGISLIAGNHAIRR